MEIFGIPLAAMMSQLLLGLVNGSFYAILSLGLAVIFGLLNVINFAHGALFMLGAMLAWPLITPGVLQGRFIVTPTPPYHGGDGAVETRPASNAHPPANATNRPHICLMRASAVIPAQARDFGDAPGASVDNAPGIGDGGINGPPGDGAT